MEIFGFNKLIACAPPTKVEAKAVEFKGGLPMIHQRYSLVQLLVLHGNGEIPSGATVYVAPENIKATWFTTVYGMEFKDGSHDVILVPTEFVKLVAFER